MRLIELALISSSALIISGAGVGAVAVQVAKWRARRKSDREGGSDGAGGSGVNSSVEGGDDSELLLP